MRIVIQRVSGATVDIDGAEHARIGAGVLVLLGIGLTDSEADADWLAKKLVGLRIFDDAEGVMNVSLKDHGGEALVVSQFTLMASYKKGNRPSYVHAARPEVAVPLYEYFCERVSVLLGRKVQTGVFGADMKVGLTNDGPVTICMDTHNKE